ncbi:contractile injection system tape measure protein [Pinibacter soli]|uniref:Contractile injection system tape measure protein n=1 Tax=Pinibacter soli TaxID=3044211 RepID=A0ABT6RBK6_9BACT|nr:contractile injection system tape measure protein [Pinibacter soli]MDI3319776.1 contractile injection system tape measure protein [Pinibacter soli]
MIERKSHIILQQKMEIHFEDLTDYIGVQNEIQELFYDRLLPAMEAIFDEAGGNKNSIVIERMEIDCGMLSNNRWKEKLVEKALNEIRSQLHQQPRAEGSSEAALINEFLFFLENGRLLWNSRIQSSKELEQVICERQLSRSEIMQLKALLSANYTAVERLCYNFTELVIRKIWQQFANAEDVLLDGFISLAQKHEFTERQTRIGLTVLLKLLVEDKHIDDVVIKELLHEVKKNNLPPQPKKSQQEVEYLYVHNAGLVILHPFLPALFAELGLWINKEWKDEAAQHTAVRVLEYLATGNHESDEFNLSFNKIICGIPLSTALLPAEVLAATTMTECDDMLRQVIQHWNKMSNTSVSVFRETFLQRNGRMQKIESGWQLHVERKGVDILIDGLPWGIGIIVLSWTKDQVHVEWQL